MGSGPIGFYEPTNSNEYHSNLSESNKAYIHHAQSAGGSEIDSTIDSLSTNIILHQPLQADKTTVLKSYVPEHPVASQIANQISLSPELEKLTHEQKQKVVDECIHAYTESVEVFENIVGEASAEHPDAKEFAHEMLQRYTQVIEAYHEILIEDSQDSHLLSPLMKELKTKLAVSLELVQDPTSTGSVGSNLQAIQNAIKNGSLREQLTLVYLLCSVLTKVFVEPTIVDRVNTRLNEKQAGFQLNTDEIDKKRVNSKVATFFPRAKPAAEFRKDGRTAKTDPTEPSPMAKDIKDLTIREYRATIDPYISESEFQAMKNKEANGEKWGERRVRWISGKNLFELNKNTDFYKQSIALGKLPVATGPSGSADLYLQGVNYLNMNEYKNKAILAFTGWMVRAGDHGYHEIREAGTWHGVDYTPGPAAFENVYPDDPNFQDEIKASMRQHGKELPGEYLKDSYQLQVAKKLGFIT